MNKIAMGLVALTLAASPTLAQAPMNFADVDLDASGELSFEELQAVWPDLTQEEFTVADMDANGSLSADEINALQSSTLPAPAPMDDAMTAPAVPLDPTSSLSDTSGQ